jgi:hypothetical protein
MLNGKFLLILLAVLISFGLVGGALYVSYLNNNRTFVSPLGTLKNLGSKNIFDTRPKKDVVNPLTGVLYTKDEAASWENNRPLGVMVNNHFDARPQTGLQSADLVYEIVAEGGITRYLAFFLTNTPEKIGPVRSIREYYLMIVKEIGDAAVMHIGWSPQAIEAIEKWPVRSLFRGGATFWRENPKNVAIEHTAYVNGKELRTLSDSLGWQGTTDFEKYKFKDDMNKYASSPVANDVNITFWYPGDFSAMFKYDPTVNDYLRFLGYDSNDIPLPHIDAATNTQIRVKNVVVQFAKETSIANDEKHRLEYQLIGSGEALIFIDGKVIKSTWSKSSRDGRTKYFDLDGNEIEFNRGTFWICVVPDRNTEQVVYK